MKLKTDKVSGSVPGPTKGSVNNGFQDTNKRTMSFKIDAHSYNLRIWEAEVRGSQAWN